MGMSMYEWIYRIGGYSEGCTNGKLGKASKLSMQIVFCRASSVTLVTFDSNVRVCDIETTCLYYWERFLLLYCIYGLSLQIRGHSQKGLFLLYNYSSSYTSVWGINTKEHNAPKSSHVANSISVPVTLAVNTREKRRQMREMGSLDHLRRQCSHIY
jgi:hypothetical protein